MKLSEADFRPKRRAGYVPSGPRRKLPVLRILLLIVAGVVVYERFDASWPRLRANFKHSGGRSRHELPATGWTFSSDSARAFVNLSRISRDAEACDTLERLRTGLCAEARAALEKGRWLRILNKPVLSQAEVSLPQNESGVKGLPVLAALEGRDAAGNFRYQRTGGDFPSSSWCDSARGCLSSPPPRIPLAHGRSVTIATEDFVSRWVSRDPEVFPVLPGRVVSLDSMGSGDYRVTLYHGNELYTMYENVQHLPDDLKIGVLVDLLKPIGKAAPVDSAALSDSSRFAMRFSVEQAGMRLEPSDFLAPEGGQSQ